MSYITFYLANFRPFLVPVPSSWDLSSVVYGDLRILVHAIPIGIGILLFVEGLEQVGFNSRAAATRGVSVRFALRF